MRPKRSFFNWQGDKITVQPSTFGNDHRRNPRWARPELPEPVVSMAEAEYERQYGTGQTADHLRERGGLGLAEVIYHLAHALERYAPPEELIPKSRRQK